MTGREYRSGSDTQFRMSLTGNVPMTSNWQNIGRFDRMLRAAVGAIALTLVFTGPRSLWGYLGLVPLATAAMGFCPLYSLLGISTRNRRMS
jgi:hypothetical protein